MGSKLSCIRAGPDRSQDKMAANLQVAPPRNHTYDEIDDNFTILSDGGKAVVANKDGGKDKMAADPSAITAKYNDVITNSPLTAQYENVVITPIHEPFYDNCIGGTAHASPEIHRVAKMTSSSNPIYSIPIVQSDPTSNQRNQSTIPTVTMTTNEIQNLKSKSSSFKISQQIPQGETVVVTSKSDVSNIKTPANQWQSSLADPANGVLKQVLSPPPAVLSSYERIGLGKESGSAGEIVYAKVQKARNGHWQPQVKPKGGGALLPPCPRPKIKESPAPAPARPTNGKIKQQPELNYVEVEFVSPAHTKVKKSPAPPSTAYTDVVSEGGRLVLIN